MSMLGAAFESERDLLIERTNANIVRSRAEGTALSRLLALTRNDACDAADAAGRRRPALRPFGIHDIISLAQRLDGSVAHWLDNQVPNA